MANEEDIMRTLCGIEGAIAARSQLNGAVGKRRGWQHVRLGEIMCPASRDQTVDPSSHYRIAGIFSFGRGFIDRGTISGLDTKYRSLARLEENDIVISRLGAWEGAVAVVGSDFDGAYVSQEYPIFVPDQERLLPRYFSALSRSPRLWELIDRSTRGSMARRKRIRAEHFLSVQIWLPPPDEQQRVASLIDLTLAVERGFERSKGVIAAFGQTVLNEAFTAEA